MKYFIDCIFCPIVFWPTYEIYIWENVYMVYRKPLHLSPFFCLASSTLWYTPFSSLAIGFTTPLITSSLSPLARLLFSLLSSRWYAIEPKKPMAIYARMIPWPRRYHGASLARYYSRWKSMAEKLESRGSTCVIQKSDHVQHSTSRRRSSCPIQWLSRGRLPFYMIPQYYMRPMMPN